MVKRSRELSEMDDLSLRQLVLNGDEVASSCLFIRYQIEIKTFLVSRGCQIDDADDVTIISLQKILKSLDTYDSGSGATFRTWALTIAKNTYLTGARCTICRKRKCQQVIHCWFLMTLLQKLP